MKLKNSILLFIICLLFSSCHKEEEKKQTSGRINISFAVTLPVPEEVQPSSRASYTDTSIENIDLLVFDENNKFIERLQVEKSELTPMANGVQFTVQMEATTENRTVHLIANARTPDGATDRVNLTISPTTLESTAIPNLQTASLVSKTGEDVLQSNVMPLIMWSRISLAGVTMISKADDVKLLRTAACINVKKAATGEGLNDFVIERIAVDRAADQGKVAPAVYNASPTATPTTTNPVAISSYIAYNKTFSEASATPSLYVYEKNNSTTDYTSIIIQAKYKGRLGYYKVVMMNGNAPWNIIRNHRYNVTITSVSGYGYENIATAVSSRPSNDLKIEVTVDKNKEYPCLIADGQDVMGLSCHQVHIYGQRGTQNLTNVELCQVYSSRGVIPNYFVSGSDWLTNVTATDLGGNVYLVKADVDFSKSSSSASTTLTIACDNLAHTIDVSWTPGISTNSDADSYVVPLITNTEKSWHIQIVDNPDWVRLNATVSTPSAYPNMGVGGMVKELNAKYFSQAYMHVAKGVNRKAELIMSCLQNNKPISRKIVVIE